MMNKLITVLSVIFLTCATPALGKDAVATMTWYKLVKMFDKGQADQLPEIMKNEPLENLHAKSNRLSFRWRGIYMRFDFVGREKAVFQFNGRDFSMEDLESSESIDRALRSKFGLIVKPREWADMLFEEIGRLSASIDAVAPFTDDLAGEDLNSSYSPSVSAPVSATELAEKDDEKYKDAFGAKFEHLLIKEKESYDLFPDDAPENDTQLGRAMQMQWDTLSGPYQVGMLKGTNNWFKAFNVALGIAAAPGESAMDAFMGYNKYNPQHIKKPWK